MNENTFFPYSHPHHSPPPKKKNNAAKRFVDVYLFPTVKKGEGEATFHEGREEGKYDGNFHMSQQLLSVIVALPWRQAEWDLSTTLRCL